MIIEKRKDIESDDFILLDEPISHLDLAKGLVTAGMTVLAMLHYANMAFRYGQDFLFAENRPIIEPGKENLPEPGLLGRSLGNPRQGNRRWGESAL